MVGSTHVTESKKMFEPNATEHRKAFVAEEDEVISKPILHDNCKATDDEIGCKMANSHSPPPSNYLSDENNQECIHDIAGGMLQLLSVFVIYLFF